MAKNHLFTGGILRVAEELGNALERLRALEIERKHQVIPLETAKAAQDATLTALNAAIAGIQAMDFQTLSARTDRQVSELEAKIEARRTEIGQAKAETDGQIAGHREQIAKLSLETRQKNEALGECVIALSGAVKEVRAELAKKIASARSEIERAEAKRVLEIVGRVDSLRDELSTRHNELAAQVSAAVEKIDAKGALNPAGVYVAGAKYNRGDVVTLNGSSYVSLVDGNAEKPSKNAKKWQLLAARGGVIAGGVAESGGGSSLPDQAGNSGKFLTTDGTDPSWATLAGGGDLLAANNLSDVAVAATAFANIKQAATEAASGVVELATSAETTAGLAVQASDTRLSDARTPTTHAASHTDGTDDIQSATAAQKGLATAAQITKLDGIEALADVTDATNVAAAGAVMSGGALGTPSSGTLTNTTDYPVATTSRTGATPQATAPAAGLLSVLAIANGETVRTDKAIFDTAAPAALGVAAAGSQIIAARRDHVHAMPSAADVGAATTSTKLDDFGAPDDNTDLNATTSAHGLLPKLSNVATEFLNGQGNWATPAGGGGGTSSDLQTFDADGTWTKPAGTPILVTVICFGAGGQGGGGCGDSAGTARIGGGGGGGGARTERIFKASDLPATVAVTVGAGGSAAGGGGSSGAGTAGTAGGNSTFGAFVLAGGGGGGKGGTAATISVGGGGGGSAGQGTTGTGTSAVAGGKPGGSATSTAIGGQGGSGTAMLGDGPGGFAEYGGGGGGGNKANGGDSSGCAGGGAVYGAAGGGGGSCLTTGNSAGGGGAGGLAGTYAAGGGGAKGTGTGGTAGTAGDDAGTTLIAGSGGGGGGANSSGTGGAGGAGGFPGGGGGGGGGGTSGGGAGGAGGNGRVIVITTY